MAENGSATKQTTRSSGKQGTRTATVNLPFVTAQFRAPALHMPHVHVPDRREIDGAVQTVRSHLPSPRETVYYGGLALLAAFELIEWPVAAAIAVGTAVTGRGEARESSRQEKAPEPREPTGGSAARPRGRGTKQ
jgi:hypothetical protein